MKIMAVDYGDSRTGLAMCDKSEILATPLTIIHMKDFDICVEKVAEAVKENKAEMVVVGNPINMNGTYGPRSEKCCLFAEKLRSLVDVEVRMWDERSSTVTAIGVMNENNKRGKKRKESLDAVAAAVILESYLAYRKNHPDE
ncbi:MAG: Holliday junction resolvase RuvX [Oscillospiraceae bacterium]|nr:Holliday junction resolvase RuvX [Oscillospiraceae bacterium]